VLIYYVKKSNFICGLMGDTTYMCPMCDDCTNWHLGDICFTTKLNRMFDNVAIVIYSFILNIWCKYVI
jgi:hypothetical protein